MQDYARKLSDQETQMRNCAIARQLSINSARALQTQLNSLIEKLDF